MLTDIYSASSKGEMNQKISNPLEAKVESKTDNEKFRTTEVGLQSLKTTEESDSPSEIQSKSIKKTLPVKQKVNGIIRFFNRRFSHITALEKEQSQNVTNLTGKIKQALDKASFISQKTKYTERSFYGKFPSSKSIDYGSGRIQVMRHQLDEAERGLIELEKYESIADQLAEKHVAFDFLPKEIQLLKNNVLYLKEKLELAENLLDLEIALKDYSDEPTWEKFTFIRNQRFTLHNALKGIFEDRLSLKEDKELQKLAKKPDFSGADIHDFIKKNVPELRGQVERLFDSILEIYNKRTKNLEHQLQTLNPLFSKYGKQSRQIDNLETCIYSKSLLSRIYRFLHDKNKLLQQLAKAKNEIKLTAAQIKDNAQFNPEEIEWIGKRVAFNSGLVKVKKEIEATLEKSSFIDAQEQVADRMDLLNHILRETFVLESDNDPRAVSLLKTKKEIMQDPIRQINEIVQRISQEKKIKKFPLGFEKLDPLMQLKALIPIVFPDLTQRTQRLFNYIEKQNIQKELLQGIQQTKTESSIDGEISQNEIPLIVEDSLKSSVEAISAVNTEDQKNEMALEDSPVFTNSTQDQSAKGSDESQTIPSIPEQSIDESKSTPLETPPLPIDASESQQINPFQKYAEIEGFPTVNTVEKGPEIELEDSLLTNFVQDPSTDSPDISHTTSSIPAQSSDESKLAPPEPPPLPMNLSHRSEEMERKSSEFSSITIKPSSLLKQIKKAKKLQKSSSKTKNEVEKRSPEELLEEVKAGKIKEHFNEVLEAIEARTLKISEVQKYLQTEITFEETMKLIFAAKRLTPEDSQPEDENENDDWDL
jgi:hypothetical protein